MNILETVKIRGLWGFQDNEAKFRFDKRFNFIIGPNGTGKTTVINLIAAALKADFYKLDRIIFSEIELILKEVGVEKTINHHQEDAEARRALLRYYISNKA